jgi:hypothetical protein
VSAVAITVAGVASAMNPVDVIDQIKLLVNGVIIRDITPSSIMRIVNASGYVTKRGEFPVYFTPPWRNVNQQNEVTSWDLFGQSTFEIQIQLKSTVTSPGVTGIQEYDFMRNVRPGPKGEQVPFLQPTAQHQFSFNVVAGRNDINTLPFAYPISRMWLLGSTPGNISQVEVYQDGNKVLEGTQSQIVQSYGEYGFRFSDPANAFTLNQSGVNVYTQPIYFDCAFVSDPDQRWWKALKCVNAMILRVYSDVSQAVTVVQETMPGSYA